MLRYETNVFSTGKLKGCQKGKIEADRRLISSNFNKTSSGVSKIKSFENYLISIAADLHVYLLKYFGRNTKCFLEFSREKIQIARSCLSNYM